MFTKLKSAETEAATVSLTFEGQNLTVPEGTTVAAAILQADGGAICRETPVSGAPRGPYCMMGVCFECLVTIDGEENKQGCLIPVRDGMVVTRQKGGVGTVPELEVAE